MDAGSPWSPLASRRTRGERTHSPKPRACGVREALTAAAYSVEFSTTTTARPNRVRLSNVRGHQRRRTVPDTAVESARQRWGDASNSYERHHARRPRPRAATDGRSTISCHARAAARVHDRATGAARAPGRRRRGTGDHAAGTAGVARSALARQLPTVAGRHHGPPGGRPTCTGGA